MYRAWVGRNNGSGKYREDQWLNLHVLVSLLRCFFLAYCELDRFRCLALIYLAIDFSWQHLFVFIKNVFREEEPPLV